MADIVPCEGLPPPFTLPRAVLPTLSRMADVAVEGARQHLDTLEREREYHARRLSQTAAAIEEAQATLADAEALSAQLVEAHAVDRAATMVGAP